MKLIVLLLVGVLSACSPFDLIKGAMSGGDGPSLEVETVVGDKEESVVGSIGDSTEVVTESFSGGINTTNVQDIPPWVMILLIVGWLLPTPTVMYGGVHSWYRGRSK